MATIQQSASRWFECWRNPTEFFCLARQQGALIPPSKHLPTYFREAYVAGLFARILHEHNPCSVRLVPTKEEPPDFQLKQNENTLGFENVIADKPDRKMWEDHAKWDAILKIGGIIPTEKSAERRKYMSEAIPKRVEEKITKYQKKQINMSKINLLIYLNTGPALSEKEMVHLTEPYKDNFQSIWMLCGSDAVRAWPERQVLSAQQDPFECTRVG